MSTAADKAAVDFLRDVTLCLALNPFREGAAGVRRGRFPLTWFRLKVVRAPLQVVVSTATNRAAVDFLRDVTPSLALNPFREGAGGGSRFSERSASLALPPEERLAFGGDGFH